MLMKGYAVFINVLTFVVFAVDKEKAKKGRFRISERTLFSLTAAGGSLGALAGMYLMRHKTKHIKFVIGVPALLAVHILLIWFCCFAG